MPNNIHFGSGFISSLKQVNAINGVNNMIGAVQGKLLSNVKINDKVYRDFHFTELPIDHSLLPASAGNSQIGWGINMEELSGVLYAAVAINDSPFVRTYRLNNATSKWESLPNPSTLPGSTGRSVALKNFNGTLYMAVSSISSPHLRTYSWSGTAWTLLSLSENPNNQSYAVTFEIHNNKLYLAATSISGPFVFTYVLIGSTFTKFINPESPIQGTGNDVSMLSFDNKLYMAVAHTTTPFMSIFYLNELTERWIKFGDSPIISESVSFNTSASLFAYKGKVHLLLAGDRYPFLSLYYYNESNLLWENIRINHPELSSKNRVGSNTRPYFIDTLLLNEDKGVLISVSFELTPVTPTMLFKLGGPTGYTLSKIPFEEPYYHGRRSAFELKLFRRSNNDIFFLSAKEHYPFIEIYSAPDAWTNNFADIDVGNVNAFSIGIAQQSGSTGDTISILQITP